MMSKKGWIIVALLLSGAAGFSLSWYVHYYAMPARSNVIHITQTFHAPVSFVAQLKNDPKAGEKIFKEFCASCHAEKPWIEVHAPRIGDKKIWAVKRQMGMDTLLNLTLRGIGAMPARGGCFECSDAQIRETIQYILSQS